MLSLHQLRCFLATYEHGSITGAADELGYAQPSVSEQVRSLEKTLGVELFRRVGRGVVPTTVADTLEIAALDGTGTFNAYAAGPPDARASIIVIQEIFGINPGIRSMVDGWAAAGYRAAAPDLFWRQRPGIELDPDVPDEMQQAFGLYQGFDVDKGIADIEASIRATATTVWAAAIAVARASGTSRPATAARTPSVAA